MASNKYWRNFFLTYLKRNILCANKLIKFKKIKKITHVLLILFYLLYAQKTHVHMIFFHTEIRNAYCVEIF
jgi:hypothetical protein